MATVYIGFESDRPGQRLVKADYMKKWFDRDEEYNLDTINPLFVTQVFKDDSKSSTFVVEPMTMSKFVEAMEAKLSILKDKLSKKELRQIVYDIIGPILDRYGGSFVSTKSESYSTMDNYRRFTVVLNSDEHSDPISSNRVFIINITNLDIDGYFLLSVKVSSPSVTDVDMFKSEMWVV